LSREIASTKINGTTNVVQTGSTYSVVRVLDKQPKGTICQLDEVRDDIVNILAAKMQNTALERLISTLRSKMIVEVHLDVISGRQGSGGDTSVAPQQSKPPDSTPMQSQE
jgi:hypothetical protein